MQHLSAMYSMGEKFSLRNSGRQSPGLPEFLVDNDDCARRSFHDDLNGETRIKTRGAILEIVLRQTKCIWISLVEFVSLGLQFFSDGSQHENASSLRFCDFLVETSRLMEFDCKKSFDYISTSNFSD